jgi:hypothetical protein
VLLRSLHQRRAKPDSTVRRGSSPVARPDLLSGVRGLLSAPATVHGPDGVPIERIAVHTQLLTDLARTLAQDKARGASRASARRGRPGRRWRQRLSAVGTAPARNPRFSGSYLLAALMTVGILPMIAPASAAGQVFSYTGSEQSYFVPPGVTQVHIAVVGAEGVPGASGAVVAADTARGAPRDACRPPGEIAKLRHARGSSRCERASACPAGPEPTASASAVASAKERSSPACTP